MGMKTKRALKKELDQALKWKEHWYASHEYWSTLALERAVEIKDLKAILEQKCK